MRASLANLQPSLIRQIHALKKSTSLDVSLGEPTLSIEPELWRRGVERFEREPQGYSPNLGLPALREAIGKHHGKTAAHVIVTVGSEEALFLVFFGMLDQGDEVIIPDPAYPAYAGLATLCGATAVRVPVTYGLEAADVQAAITPKTKLIVTASPSNPFGAMDDLDGLDTDVPILSDEIYRDLYFAQPPKTPKGAMVVSGLSKSCAMTGHRIGYLVAEPDLVQKLWPVHQLAVTAASTLSQQIAIEAFLEPRFLSAHRHIYADRWQQAKRALDRLGLPYVEPQGAFYVMLPVVPEGVDAFDFCKKFLAEQDVVSVPGTAFGPSGARFVRFSFAGEPGTFAEAAKRLTFALRSGV